MAQASLLALSGPLEGNELPLLEQEFTIGRDESNSLCLEEPTVSRRHCLIRREGSGFKLRDLGSANRTKVNGLPAEETELAHGDEIAVGSSRLKFLANGDVPVTPDEIFSATSTVVLRSNEARYAHTDQVLDRNDHSPHDHSPHERHLKTLLRAASAISSAADLEDLQSHLIEALREAIPADRGAIVLDGDVSEGYFWSRDGKEFRPPQSIVTRVMDEGVAVCLNDILLENGEDASLSIKRSRINSLLAAPIGTGGNPLGVLYLDSRRHDIRLGEEDLQLTAGIAAMALAPLANALRVKRLERENQRLEQELRGEGGMVGDSPRMRDVYKFIRRAAPSGSTVLICGESGSGKELVARAIHQNSSRSARHFVAINCAAITETLLESEFFGHEKGAFTGAALQKRGKLEEADGGTVFLDEIGELAPLLQAKLLRVLQEREFERVGGTRTIRIDIRVVAATNRDLAEMVRKGSFRQDLFYRLNVVSVTLPPLRERRADINPLATFFLEKHRDRAGRFIAGISPSAQTCLMNYDWPGNVRELQNAIEHAVVLGTTDEILPEDLPDSIVQTGPEGDDGETPATGGKFHETIRQIKRQLVVKAMDQAKQNYTEAARLLGLHPNNLHRLMKSLNLK